MIRRASAFVALPGGPGTIDEMCEVIALAKAGIQQKPCVLVNVNGFFDSLQAQYKRMLEEGFATEEELDLVMFSENFDDIFSFINSKIEAQ